MPVVKLKNYITQIRGVSYKPTNIVNSENGYPILRANNIQDELDFDDLVYVSTNKISEKQFLTEGDIVICASSGSKNLVGKAAVFYQYTTPISFGAFCKTVRVNDDSSISKQFIQLYFQSKYYREQISASSIGANINNIKTEDIDNLNINIPDLSVQEEAVINLTNIIMALKSKKEQLSSLDELIKSRFIEMFDNASWQKQELAGIIVFLRNGLTIKQEKGAKGIPITRIETLANTKFNYDRLGYANIFELSDKQKNYLLNDGDLLISHINSVEYIGRTVQYHAEQDKYILHGMNLLCMRLKDGVNPTYIEYYFRSEEVKSYFKSITKKAVNQASMSTSDMKLLQVSLPPVELQNEFADYVKLIDKSKFIVQQEIKDLQELLDSKMDEYFS